MEAPHDDARRRLAELHAEFKARGWNRPSALAVAPALVLHSALMAGGAALATASSRPLVTAAALALAAFGTMGVAGVSHTASHHAAAASRRANEALTAYGLPFVTGISMTYWRHAHVVVHHPAPNVAGVDADADFRPWFATREGDADGAGAAARFYYARAQRYVFPLVVWLNIFTRHRAGWRHLLPLVADPRRRRPAHALDLALLALHYAVWVALPALAVGLGPALGLYLARMSLFGLLLFAILAPAHYPAEAAVVAREGAPDDFVLAQTATTVNFRAGPVGRLVCAGLQYQIEHHLFPGYSHVHYPAMSPRVRAFCERHGYPYRTLGWREALAGTLAMLRAPKPVAARLERGQGSADGRSRYDRDAA